MKDGKVFANSREVAEVFGKRHCDVLRDIRRLECSAEFHRSNFGPNEINDLTGTSTESVDMTRDGLTFLVMGFTGAKAAQFKEAYILATFVVMDETERRLWEIAENLHRAELTVLERSNMADEWIALTEAKQTNIGATCADIPRGRGQPQGGINAAVRELNIPEATAQRAVKAESLPAEAKALADEAKLGTVARARAAAAPEDQVAAVRSRASRSARVAFHASNSSAWSRRAAAAMSARGTASPSCQSTTRSSTHSCTPMTKLPLFGTAWSRPQIGQGQDRI